MKDLSSEDIKELFKQAQRDISTDEAWKYIDLHTGLYKQLPDGNVRIKDIAVYGFFCGILFALENLESVSEWKEDQEPND